MNSGTCTDVGGTRASGSSGGAVATVRVEGGTYTGTGVTISGDRGSAPAVHVSGTGTVDLRGESAVSTTQDHAYGVEVHAGGSLYAEDVSITTEGYGSDAITMIGAGAYVSLTNVDIVANGGSARGIRMQEGAIVEGVNVTILSTHLNHDDAGMSHGIAVESGSSVTLTDSTITAEGPQSSGAEIWGGTLIGTRLEIRATGPGHYSSGVYLWGEDALLNLTDGLISSEGDGAPALVAESEAVATLNDVEVSASGAGAHGVHISDGGTVTGTDVDVAVTGLGASALSMSLLDSDELAQMTLTGGSLSSLTGALITVEGAEGSITLNGPMVLDSGLVDGRRVFASVTESLDREAELDLVINDVTGVTGLIEVTGSGNTLDVELHRSQWAGDLEASGNTANVSLNASRWTGTATSATTIDVDAASEWTITASSDAALVNNAGRIAFQPPTGPFSTLTTTDYVGQGGTLVVNTRLDSDGSPSDLLVIDGGSASGTTGLVVDNAGGGGALTLGDGILVIDAINGGTTEVEAFHLASRAAAGAYEYLLYRGGQDDEHDWFLRSYLIEEPEVPLIRPEAALYSPVPEMARQLGLAYLGTLHERVGEQMNIRPQPDQEDHYNGRWGRLIGEYGSNNWSSTLDVSAQDVILVGAQGGIDIYRAEDNDGYRDHLGVYGAYARQSSRISGHALAEDNLTVGSLTLEGPAVGGYWTRYSPEGGYFDAVVQANLFGVDGNSDYSARLRTYGLGFTASIEAGQPIAFADGWQFEPQAQLIYQSVLVADGNDTFSSVSWQEGDEITGRIGARLQFTSEDDDTLWQPYLKANLWHGFGGVDHLTLGTSPSFETRYGNTSLELGVGLTARVTDTASLYGHVDYRWSLDGVEHQSLLQGALGMRVNW